MIGGPLKTLLSSHKKSVVAVLVLVYVVVFPLLNHTVDDSGAFAVVSLLPLLAVAWFYGVSGALIAGLACAAFNELVVVVELTIIRGAPVPAAHWAAGWSGEVALIVVGLLVGQLSTTNFRLNRAFERIRVLYRDNERATHALRDSEEKYRSLVNNSAQGVVVVQAGKICFASPPMLSMILYPEASLVGTTFEGIVHHEDRGTLDRLNAQAKVEVGDNPVPIRIMRFDESLFWADVNSVAIGWQGSPARLFFITDISERKRLESEFLQAQKMEAVGRLAGGVAHDFNNILMVIMGFCDILANHHGDADQIEKNVAVIKSSAARAAALTQQLLAFSRKQLLEPTVINANDLLTNIAELVERLLGEHIRLVLRLDENLGSVRADVGQLQQVIMNLALNARDAMPRGGHLILETRNILLDESFRKVRPETIPGNYVMISVSDTGVGMDSDVLTRAFEPFFTTKEQGRGSGLGLSTAYGIVKQSGGYLYAYSELGIGSVFNVIIPRIDAEPATSPADDAARTNDEWLRGKETVLLVENEQALRDWVRTVLEDAGYVVYAAANGRRALDIFEQHIHPPDVLITDVVMQEMGGVELAQNVRERFPSIKTVFMTGYPSDFVEIKALITKGSNLLLKPFDSSRLLGTLRKALDERRDTAASAAGG